MGDLVTSTLRDMGPAGAVISVLLTAIGGLVSAVMIQYRQGNKVYGYRLAERDTLNKALTDNTAAINAMTRATEERNRVTEELAAAIGNLASAFERVNDRLEMQHTVMKDEVQRHGLVVSAVADAMRNVAGIVTDVRNHLQQQPQRRPR